MSYYCNTVIHNYLKYHSNYWYCPFCEIYQLHETQNIKKYKCCDKIKIINNNGAMVCQICGIISYYEYCNEYIDFYDKYYLFNIKSIYNRKYHINKILNKCNLNYTNKEKIKKIFQLMDKHIYLINKKFNRKRLINNNFLLSKIFEIMNIKNNNIKITNVLTTKNLFEDYWNEIVKIMDYDMQKILKRENTFHFIL